MFTCHIGRLDTEMMILAVLQLKYVPIICTYISFRVTQIDITCYVTYNGSIRCDAAAGSARLELSD